MVRRSQLGPRTIVLTRTLFCLPWLALLGWLAGVSWFLCDDAFISFRYVRNLLEGNGLVFNPGEYVEGYSNFLWILELAAIWGFFGVRPEHSAPYLSVAYTVGTIAVMLWWIARSPSRHDRGLIAWMSLGLLCSSATFAVWTSGGGLETRQFTFFVIVAVVCLAVHNNTRWGLIVASLSLAAASYTRPEGPLLAACCFGWFAVQRLVANRRLDLRELAALVAPFALLVGAHFLFRYAYYGEWLPNTYYAKHVRPWYESGFRYLVAGTIETGLYLLVPLAYLALRVRWRIYRDSIYGLVLLCLGAHMAYILYIGGDLFEFRPFDFYWPLLAPPAAQGIALLSSKVSASLRRIRSLPWRFDPQSFAIVIFVPVLFYSGAIQGILLFESAGMPGEPGVRLHIELNDENAGWLLSAPLMPVFVAISNDMRRQLGMQSVGVRFVEHREDARRRIPMWKPYEEMSRGVIPQNALMVTDGAGILPYYVPDLRIIDLYGLIDATVARTPVTRDNHERQMAHDRRPPPGYLQQRGVNFIIYPPASSDTVALDRANYAARLGPELWMPFEATDSQWAIEHFADQDLRTRAEIEFVDFWGRIGKFGARLTVTVVEDVLEADYSILTTDDEEAIITPESRLIPVIPEAVRGHVDKGKLARLGSGTDMAFISGWAADIQRSQPASAILIIANGAVIYAGPPTFERPDVARHFGNDALVKSGFALLLPAIMLGEGNPAGAEVRVFALSSDGVASELVYDEEFEWRKPTS